MAKKVFLSAGHGGKDPGAVGNGLKEKDLNLSIMLANKAVLERHGITVVCSRTKDENDPVAEEVREANASGAAIAMSHHINSAPSNKADGSETYYHSASKKGKKLAQLCEKQTKALGQNSRGAKANDGLWFIRGTRMPAVLTESAFICNKDDIAIIDTVKEQQKFGEAYAKAILAYFKIKYKEVVTSKVTTGKKEPVSVAHAKSFDKKYAKTFTVTAQPGLKMRTGAGVKNPVIVAIAKGNKVNCYGYYTEHDGTTWLLCTWGKYAGFMSKNYLK